MKVSIGTWCNAEKYGVINVSYVVDRSDKFLVLIDNNNKKKIIPDTIFGGISDSQVFDLLDSYCRNFLKLDDSQIQNVTYSYKGKPNKACHNDDFYNVYKKGYEVIGPKESNVRYC